MIMLSKSITLTDAISCATTFEHRLPQKSSPPSTPSPSSAPSNPKPVCNKCNRPGHTQEKCYAKTTIKTEPDGLACSYCKLNGHRIADCSQRKENNRKYHGDENYRPPRMVNFTQIETIGSNYIIINFNY